MFLERSLNNPTPPHFKHLSLLPPPHPPPLPPTLKILIIHLLNLSYFEKAPRMMLNFLSIFLQQTLSDRILVWRISYGHLQHKA